jgi:hypothetical protein
MVVVAAVMNQIAELKGQKAAPKKRQVKVKGQKVQKDDQGNAQK